MKEEMTGKSCCLGGTPPFPEETVPGMAYIPYQQWSDALHDAQTALRRGTLFPVLDKPFLGGGQDND